MFRGEVCAKLRQYLFLTVSDKEFVKKTGSLLFRYWCIEIFVWPTWPIKTEFYDGGWSGKSFNSYKSCHSVITFCRLSVSNLLLFRWSLCLKSSQTRNQRRNSQRLLVSSSSRFNFSNSNDRTPQISHILFRSAKDVYWIEWSHHRISSTEWKK